MRQTRHIQDDQRRADLYRYAAQTVGTASSPTVEHARIERLLAWADGLWLQRSSKSLLERMRLRRAVKERSADPEPAGTYAVHSIGKVSDEIHAEVLRLVDELIAVGQPGYAVPVASRPTGDLAAYN